MRVRREPRREASRDAFAGNVFMVKERPVFRKCFHIIVARDVHALDRYRPRLGRHDQRQHGAEQRRA